MLRTTTTPLCSVAAWPWTWSPERLDVGQWTTSLVPSKTSIWPIESVLRRIASRRQGSHWPSESLTRLLLP
jgi:hypothetical protein